MLRKTSRRVHKSHLEAILLPNRIRNMITVPQAQKALFLSSISGDFVVGTRHVDKPGPGELLVKVYSASLNPGDWKIQRIEKAGKMVDGYPWVGGWDGSGEVVEVGGEVYNNEGFKKGDRVMFQCVEFKTRYGAFQQYVIVRVGCVAKISPNISYDEAATMPLVLATAYGALSHVNPWGFGVLDKDVVRGEPFVVIGGATGVGQMRVNSNG
ncbi:chaperonin 10-like protein [Panaeolus papilionaceus]|nr:chaperonin 10-like protein [Panaeolus papilionaceus]